MTALLTTLASIALLDSLTMVPICIIPIAILMGGAWPLLGVAAFIGGIAITYYLFGLLAALGLDQVLEPLNAYLLRLWHQPNTTELIIQILLGLAALAFAARILDARKKAAERPLDAPVSPVQAFAFGAGLVLLGIPGAVPYFAAINEMLRADLTTTGFALALLFYGAVFVLPLLAIVGLRLLLGASAQSWLDGLQGLIDRWGRRLLIALLVVFGLIMVVDAIGWFAGHPLIPVG
jgi:cytochrome c biogenesis protein CcdA